MMKFQIFIGIDQTGAVDSKGIPKSLQTCVIDARKRRIKIYSCLQIKTLNQKSIQELILRVIPDFKNERVLICIDTVFGLPAVLKVSKSSLFKSIKNFNHHSKAYGAITAHAFFNQFLVNGKIEHRHVELKVKANSIFNLKPFQRNIGCGSYRIIKELAQDKSWFSLWPIEKPILPFVICEGYPSHFWKSLLGAKKRNLNFIQEMFPQLHFDNMDQADSFVLAYGAMKSQSQLFEKEFHPLAEKEGWILGVPFK